MAEKSKAHIVFLTLGSIFGLSFIILTPPFQTPDESTHFLRAYHISTGHLTAIKQDSRVGGYIPHAIDSFTRYFLPIQGAMYGRTNKEAILNLGQLTVDEDESVFVDFPIIGKYSFICYLPQSLSIFISKKVFSG